jgi:hypothetical protein
MVCPYHIIFCLILKKKDIQTYRNMSNLTGKNQAGPTMFSAYRSENPVKICSLQCRSMFGTNYISLRVVTRLGLRNAQAKLFTENAYLKK